MAIAGASRGATADDSSLFDIPVSRGARLARIFALLLLDAVFVAVGVAFILSYLDARAQAAEPAASASASESVRAVAAPGDADGSASTAERSVRTEIATAVDQHRAEIQKCYSEVTRESGPETMPEGRLDIALTIDASGRVSRAEPEVDETGSESLTRCVVTLFSGFHVAERVGGQPVEMVWPLRFQAPR